MNVSKKSNWKKEKLNSILQYIEPRIEISDEKKYTTIKVKRNHGGLEKREELFGNQIKTKKQYRVIPDSFIISRVQCWHKAFALVENISPNMIASTNYDQFQIKPLTDKKFFWWLSHSPNFLKTVRDSAKGVDIEKMVFNREKWLNQELSLPEINEQKRIVSKIEELFSKIDSTKQSVEKTKLQLESYRQSLLKSAFEKLGEKFDLHSLDNICMKITDGEHLRPNYTNSGIPFLTAKNITDTGVIFENIDFVSQKDAEKFRSRCNPELNDILIVSRGATVGRLCIVNTKKEFCLLGSVILLKTKKEINSKFLAFFLKSPIEKQNLVKISGSTAQQAIYLRDIKKSFIPLPPLEEQEQIVSQIEQSFSLLENTQNIVNSTLQTLQTMKMSILKKAFEGKLVQ